MILRKERRRLNRHHHPVAKPEYIEVEAVLICGHDPIMFRAQTSVDLEHVRWIPRIRKTPSEPGHRDCVQAHESVFDPGIRVLKPPDSDQ